MSVVNLSGKAIAVGGTAPVADSETIRLLEEALERARSGEICGVAIIMEHSNEQVSATHRISASYRVIGALAALHHTLCVRQVSD